MATLHYRIKTAVVEAIKGLELGDGTALEINDNVQSQIEPDTSNLKYPCVVVAHTPGSERDNNGTTQQKWLIYPVLVLILDAETARFHANEDTYLTWRKQIWDLFNDRRAPFRRPAAAAAIEVPEVNWCKAVSGTTIDPKWTSLQSIASRIALDVYTIEDRARS